MQLDYTSEPPTLTMNEYMKTNHFDMLKPEGEHIDEGTTYDGKPYKETLYKYDLIKLRELTSQLMHYCDYNFQMHSIDTITDKNELEDFTEEEQQLFLPMAFMLACVDGNAFPMGVKSYIPYAYKIMRCNGWSIEEMHTLKETINKAK